MPLGSARRDGGQAVYDKPGVDGSAKLNIRSTASASVTGVIYEIEDKERARLDAAEPAYTPIEMPLGLTYAYEGEPATTPPAVWYVDIVEAGARSHGLEAPRAERVA